MSYIDWVNATFAWANQTFNAHVVDPIAGMLASLAALIPLAVGAVGVGIVGIFRLLLRLKHGY